MFLDYATVKPLLGAILVLSCVSCGPSAPLVVENARVMQPLPGKSISSAYFDLTNNQANPVTLIRAETSVANRIEMHQILRSEDQVRMQQIQRVDVPGESRVSFEKGGLHLMLFDFEPPVELGNSDSMNISLVFADGSRIDAPFRLERW